MLKWDFLPISHTLLDAKITNVLSLCHDQVILNAVQNIIQNMITLEDGSQQQPHYLQSMGFGGLWRFAGPFTKVGNINLTNYLIENVLKCELCMSESFLAFLLSAEKWLSKIILPN